MNLKASKSSFKKKNMNPNDYAYCCVIGCHGNSLLHLILTKQTVVRDFKGAFKVFYTSMSQRLCRVRY